MRNLQRNARTFWYSLYEEVEPITTTDEWGNAVETGEQSMGYGDPVEMSANISPATGASITEQFGNLDNYDKVIVTADMSCPIDENTVLYIDTTPPQPYDYVVRGIAKSLNSISIAIRKVDVS